MNEYAIRKILVALEDKKRGPL